MKLRKDNPKCSTLELTPELAQEIYNNANGYATPIEMFQSQSGYDWSNIKKVFRWARKIVKLIDNIMSGTFVIVEAVKDPETGEIITPAEYFNVTTKAKFITRLNIENVKIIDAKDVLEDYMDGQNWNAFKSNY